MALCSQADVENRLQITFDNQPDAVVASLITDAQALIEAEVGRTLESDTRVETLDAGRGVLFLKWFPVTAVASVVEDGTPLTVDDDYKFYPYGTLIRLDDGDQIPWRTLNPQAVVVTYTGGYLAGEPDHDMALEHLGSLCAELVARAFRKGSDAASIPAGAAGQVQSVSLTGSDTVTYATGGGATTSAGGLSQFVFLLDEERRQLARYKAPAVA